jgi:putative glutamine amidotransferase
VDTITVSSEHHQAIDRLGAGLHAIACAADGCVEAVEHRAAGILAVQWLPEDHAAARSHDQALFDDLVERARQSVALAVR